IPFHDWPEDIDVTGEIDERGVDQFHRGWFQANNRFGGLHGLSKGREMANAQYLVFDRWLQVDIDALEESQGALRADQELCQVGWMTVSVWSELIEVIAADAAIHVREEACNFVSFAFIKG